MSKLQTPLSNEDIQTHLGSQQIQKYSDLKNYKNESQFQMSHLAMVNYQVIENNNKEEACISIFEFDEIKN